MTRFFSIILTAMMTLCLVGCSAPSGGSSQSVSSSSSSSSQSSSVSTARSSSNAATVSSASSAQDAPITERASSDVGTTARVDEIAKIAKADAAKMNEAMKEEAISYIVEAYPNFYGDNETMENVMYYGYLLDYGFGDSTPESNLGTDAYQAVKYVYRGAEGVSDPATQENLDQIRDDLGKLGISVR